MLPTAPSWEGSLDQVVPLVLLELGLIILCGGHPGHCGVWSCLPGTTPSISGAPHRHPGVPWGQDPHVCEGSRARSWHRKLTPFLTHQVASGGAADLMTPPAPPLSHVLSQVH